MLFYKQGMFVLAVVLVTTVAAHAEEGKFNIQQYFGCRGHKILIALLLVHWCD